ncbi:hypothetical protein SHELI_v1c10230 [Spiroplasma helicoides]|uniref:Uncharacterized protein n=1 Tax=Spiroplasma helicoides TaxID=216938 RepID=A0A1B3SM33_9MOLU|nr:hypothetical protein [Spiroplasma helicoides]AOG60970.1 hypothetical protein SHELI_v1c10230 [Spiroplasma helicoides]
MPNMKSHTYPKGLLKRYLNYLRNKFNNSLFILKVNIDNELEIISKYRINNEEKITNLLNSDNNFYLNIKKTKFNENLELVWSQIESKFINFCDKLLKILPNFKNNSYNLKKYNYKLTKSLEVFLNDNRQKIFDFINMTLTREYNYYSNKHDFISNFLSENQKKLTNEIKVDKKLKYLKDFLNQNAALKPTNAIDPSDYEIYFINFQTQLLLNPSLIFLDEGVFILPYISEFMLLFVKKGKEIVWDAENDRVLFQVPKSENKLYNNIFFCNMPFKSKVKISDNYEYINFLNRIHMDLIKNWALTNENKYRHMYIISQEDKIK